KVSWAEKGIALKRASPAFLLIFTIFAGLYSGVFTVNEAASLAAVVSLLFAVARKSLTLSNFYKALWETAVVVGMLYFILIGAAVFVYFVSIAQIPERIVEIIGALEVPGILVIFGLLLGYLVLGAIFDEMAAMVVTLPFVLPIVVSLGYDPIWWGVINVVIIELGMMIPPIGIVILIVHGMAPQISLKSLYLAITPFIVVDIMLLVTLVLFPSLVSLVPSWM
ncbi:TRAP transporter large permease subunit, partial [Paraburkholderia aspalathi]|nr:TRAP transporter large permease subunit [Paraburkholderia aspalathi]